MRKQKTTRAARSRRGGILIATIIVSTIVAAMLAGLGSMLTSAYSRTMDESNYANAINLADAGVNYEMRKVASSASTADLPGSTAPYGTSVAFGNGSFRVYCTMADGITAWDKTTTPFMIISSGSAGTTTRTVNVKTKGTYSNGLPNFGLFGTTSVQVDSSSCTITHGDVGCNGSISCSGSCPNGKCWLAGSSASQTGFSGSSCVSLSNSCNYPTCSQVALTSFPNSGATAPGGLSYLSSHNDNSRCGLSTYNASITSSCTLTGPCNVYVQGISLTGNQKITCNNTNGAVNIWVASGSGTCHFDTNSGVTCTSSDTTKPCTVYCSNSGNTLNGYCTCDVHDSCSCQCNFYACRGGYGDIQCYDSPSVGCCIGDTCHIHGGATCTAQTASSVAAPIPADSYAYGNYWLEVGGL